MFSLWAVMPNQIRCTSKSIKTSDGTSVKSLLVHGSTKSKGSQLSGILYIDTIISSLFSWDCTCRDSVDLLFCTRCSLQCSVVLFFFCFVFNCQNNLLSYGRFELKIYIFGWLSIYIGAVAASMSIEKIMESSMESSSSSSLFSSSSLASEIQGDEPWNNNNNQLNSGGDVATPSLMDLSTGLMGLDSGLVGGSTDDQLQSGGGGGSLAGSESGPLFDSTTERNVTVLVGRTANLHCRVRYLGNRTVS